MIESQKKIEEVTKSIAYFLKEKNLRYGNSALEPLSLFTSFVSERNTTAVNNFYTRLDDKLSRIKNADELRKNDIVDLIGYLLLLCINNDWTDFQDLLD